MTPSKDKALLLYSKSFLCQNNAHAHPSWQRFELWHLNFHACLTSNHTSCELPYMFNMQKLRDIQSSTSFSFTLHIFHVLSFFLEINGSTPRRVEPSTFCIQILYTYTYILHRHTHTHTYRIFQQNKGWIQIKPCTILKEFKSNK